MAPSRPRNTEEEIKEDAPAHHEEVAAPHLKSVVSSSCCGLQALCCGGGSQFPPPSAQTQSRGLKKSKSSASTTAAAAQQSRMECIFSTIEIRRLAEFTRCCFQAWLHMMRELMGYRYVERQRCKFNSSFDRMLVVWGCLDKHGMLLNCFSTWRTEARQLTILKNTTEQMQRLHDRRYTNVLRVFNQQYELALIVWAWVDNFSLALSCLSMWLDTVEVQKHAIAIGIQYDCYLKSIASGEFHTLNLLLKTCFRSWAHRSREHILKRHARALEVDCECAHAVSSAQCSKALEIIESVEIDATELRVQSCLRFWAQAASDKKRLRSQEAEKLLERSVRNVQINCILELLASGERTSIRRFVQCCLRSWAHLSGEKASQEQSFAMSLDRIELFKSAQRSGDLSEKVLAVWAQADRASLVFTCFWTWLEVVQALRQVADSENLRQQTPARGMRHDRILEVLGSGESSLVKELRILCYFHSWVHASREPVARADRWKLWLDSCEASRHAQRCDEKCDKALSIWASADTASLNLGCFWTWSETVLDMKRARQIESTSFIVRFTRSMQYDRILEILGNGDFLALRLRVQCCLRSWASRSMEKVLRRHARTIEADRVIVRSAVRRQYQRIDDVIASREMYSINLLLLCCLRSWSRLPRDQAAKEQFEINQVTPPGMKEKHNLELRSRDDMYARAVAAWTYCDKISLCQGCFSTWLEAVEQEKLALASEARKLRSHESYNTALDIWECFTMGSVGLYCFSTWFHALEQAKLMRVLQQSLASKTGMPLDSSGTQSLRCRQSLCGQILGVIALAWSRACMVQVRCCLLAWAHLAMAHLAFLCRRTLAGSRGQQASSVRESSAPARSASMMGAGTPSNPLAISRLASTHTNGWVPVAMSPRGMGPGPGVVGSKGEVLGPFANVLCPGPAAKYLGTSRETSAERISFVTAAPATIGLMGSGTSLAAALHPPRLVPSLS